MFSIPVKNPRPHHTTTAVDGDVNTQCLVHPHNVTKPKVQRNEWSYNGRQRGVGQAHDQNKKMVGELEMNEMGHKTNWFNK